MKYVYLAALSITLGLLLGIGSARAECDYSGADANNGYGWDNVAKQSCAPIEPPEAPPKAERAICENPGLSDPDGDGYGWENGVTCLVETASTPPPEPEPISITFTMDGQWGCLQQQLTQFGYWAGYQISVTRSLEWAGDKITWIQYAQGNASAEFVSGWTMTAKDGLIVDAFADAQQTIISKGQVIFQMSDNDRWTCTWTDPDFVPSPEDLS